MSKPSASRFSTRLDRLLSVLGIAGSTGSIWRFPRIAARNFGGEGQFRMYVILSADGDRNPDRLWDVLAGVPGPVQAVLFLGWWLHRSSEVYASDTWFRPLEPFSIMRYHFRWGFVLAIE